MSRTVKFLRHAFLFAGSLFLLARVVSAADNDWFAREWQTDEGLLDNNVRAVTQTPDGYLWVATETGLSRFDGSRFETIFSSVSLHRENSAERLLSDSQNRFWMAMYRGNVLCVQTNGTHEYAEPEGFAKTYPTSLLEDRNRAIWISFNDGQVTRLQNNIVTRFNAAEGLPTNNAYCRLTLSGNGTLWFAKDRYLGIFDEGKFQTRATLPRRVTRLTTAAKGGIWVLVGAELFHCAENGTLEKRAQLPPGAGPTICLEDRSGVLWIGTAAHGLFSYAGNELRSIHTSQKNISCLMEDREGNLWVGTNGGGLVRLRPRIVEVMDADSGLPFESLRSVCKDAGNNLWVVTWNAELWHQDGGKWIRDFPQGGNLFCVAADPAGPVWVGSRTLGLFQFRDGAFSHAPAEESLARNPIRSLLVASNHDLWVTTDSLSGSVTLQRLRGTNWHTFELPKGVGVLRALVEDQQANIWIGSDEGKLLRVTDDCLVDETAKTGSAPAAIRCLKVTADGMLWIGYAGFGLGRLKGERYDNITTAQGLSDDYISQIMDDGRGWFWLAGNRGLFKVNEQELNEVADGKLSHVRSVIYGRGEGVPGLQAAYETATASFRDSEDCLWLAARAGLVAIHADKIRDNPEPPRVLIERVTANSRPVALYQSLASLRLDSNEKIVDLRDGRAKLRLPPNRGKVEIEFTALSFSAPENVQFKYRLDNVDEQWIEGGTQRSASYSRLLPGDYTFRVIACNNSGVWNETGAMLAFTVLPYFWQTWTFRLLVLAAFTAALIAAVRYVSFRRLRLRVQALTEKAAVDKERARIAQDLHDDLGASLTHVTMSLELALQEPTTEKPNSHLREGLVAVRQTIKSLDETVWAVNPRNNTLPELIGYIAQFAVEFLENANVRCALDLPDNPPDLPVSAELRHNLFLIVKEALNNVVRHANAHEVKFQITADEQRVGVTIQDNGCGFENAPNSGSADGLRNMRQRAEQMGGQFQIASEFGRGTRIVVSTDLSPKK